MKNIQSVKEQIAPRCFYNNELALAENISSRKWTRAGLCPFHQDRHAGSFFINGDSGAFKCFSCGAKGGDIVAFVCRRYSLSIPEALEKLSNDF